MKLSISKSKNAESFYITQSYIDDSGKAPRKLFGNWELSILFAANSILIVMVLLPGQRNRFAWKRKNTKARRNRKQS